MRIIIIIMMMRIVRLRYSFWKGFGKGNKEEQTEQSSSSGGGGKKHFFDEYMNKFLDNAKVKAPPIDPSTALRILNIEKKQELDAE